MCTEVGDSWGMSVVAACVLVHAEASGTEQCGGWGAGAVGACAKASGAGRRDG